MSINACYFSNCSFNIQIFAVTEGLANLLFKIFLVSIKTMLQVQTISCWLNQLSCFSSSYPVPSSLRCSWTKIRFILSLGISGILWFWQNTSVRIIIESLLQASIVKDSSISVSRVAWSPDGNLIGMYWKSDLPIISPVLSFFIELFLLQELHLRNILSICMRIKGLMIYIYI